MSKNCLKTQLREVVQNDNLEYLDKIPLTITFKSGLAAGANVMSFVKIDASQSINVENLNTDNAIIRIADSIYLFMKKDTLDTGSLFISKYNISSINVFNDNIGINLSEFSKFYQLKGLTCGTTIMDSLANIKKFTALERFQARNYNKKHVNISVFAEVNTLKQIELDYCTTIEGDLSAIKDMPNLTSVVLDHTYVTDNNNTVAYLQNRGVEVTYVPYSN